MVWWAVPWETSQWGGGSERESKETTVSNMGPRDSGYVINKRREAWKRGEQLLARRFKF